jgi:hypothetical protein
MYNYHTNLEHLLGPAYRWKHLKDHKASKFFQQTFIPKYSNKYDCCAAINRNIYNHMYQSIPKTEKLNEHDCY